MPPGAFSREDNYSGRRMAPSIVCQQSVLATMETRIFTLLQQRQKWHKPQRNVAANDIVLLLNENTSRSIWPLGQVIEV